MAHTTTLYNPVQAQEVIASMQGWAVRKLEAGRRLTLTIAEAKRSGAQNDHMQAIVRSIGRKIGHKDHDRLRCLLVEQWRHETQRGQVYAPSFDGLRMVDVSNRTSAMDTPDSSEFIEWLLATDAGL